MPPLSSRPSTAQSRLPLRQAYTTDTVSRGPEGVAGWHLDNAPDTKAKEHVIPRASNCILTKNGEPLQMKRPLSKSEVTAVLDAFRTLEKAKRDYRRVAQQKYVMKKARAVKAMENYIPLLRDEIDQLQYRRDRLLYANVTLWAVIVKYFRIFEFGLFDTKASFAKVLGFLRAVIAPDVDAGITSGFESLLSRWRTFTQAFPDIHVELTSLKRVAKDCVVASTTTSVTLTKKSLQGIFPHLVDDTKHYTQLQKRIMSRLLGQRLIIPASMHFGWDSGSKCVTKIHTHADMMSPFLELVALVTYHVLPDSAHCLKISIDTEDQLAKNRMPPAKDGGKATLRGPNWDMTRTRHWPRLG
ncbi:unnamed protein product [Phytophthora fragariaefolia]|uniref:Unnamed protein product n=1 Tax=Phytophthora fragariaefolia TaxID=1490495 RepID=A0A9W6WYM0_9STRA|nr:unnamed protein product [Phytophthora fragariaefolia]